MLPPLTLFTHSAEFAVVQEMTGSEAIRQISFELHARRHVTDVMWTDMWDKVDAMGYTVYRLQPALFDKLKREKFRERQRGLLEQWCSRTATELTIRTVSFFDNP